MQGAERSYSSEGSYVFNNLPDALAYFIISAVIPATYIFVDFSKISDGESLTVVALAFTLLSSCSSFAYDYISRYNDELVLKKPWIYDFLLIGCILYVLSSIAALVGAILLVTQAMTLKEIVGLYHFLVFVSIYAPIVSLVECIRYIYKMHKGKRTRARGV